MSKNSVLALMCGVVAMTVLDLSVVNVALPSIQRGLNATPADLQWVVVIYGVVVAGFLLRGGRTGDLVGHRRVLVTGIGVLAAASLVAGRLGHARGPDRRTCGPGLRRRAGGAERPRDPLPNVR